MASPPSGSGSGSGSGILLRSGTLVSAGLTPTSPPLVQRADVLIEGSRITRIGPSLAAPSAATKVVDCTDKLISPGFIDTHRHLWQTALKGRHADENLGTYIFTGSHVSDLFSPADVYWGTLAGALEGIAAGTTTVVDFANAATSAQDPRAARTALADSGLRGVFALCHGWRVLRWSPKFEMGKDVLPAWWDDVYREMSAQAPWADGRIRLGIAFDGYMMGREKTTEAFEKWRGGGAVQLITSHDARGPARPKDAASLLAEWGLLGPDILLAHFTRPTEQHVKDLVGAGAHFSSSPSNELQMGLGFPEAFRPDLLPHGSLSVDCHSATSASLVSEMRVGLQAYRAEFQRPELERNQTPAGIGPSVDKAFWLATRGGAKAVGLEKEIGALEVGMRADVVVWDALSPGMVGTEDYPVAAIVLHSSVADVETVIVDGIVRKEGGKLVPVTVTEGDGIKAGERTWRDVAAEVTRSGQAIQREWKKLDFEKAMQDR